MAGGTIDNQWNGTPIGNFWDPVLLFQDGFEQGDTGRWSGASAFAEP